MRIKLLNTIILLMFCTLTFGQQTSAWEKWEWLIGEWKGEGSGKPGQGEGTFSFKFSLDRKILERTSHSEYPATGSKPKIVHDDLMIIYLDVDGTHAKAIYFDNEGHIINYSVSYSDKSVVLTSNKMPNMPIFRLTYTDLGQGAVNTKFEISNDGMKFSTYIEGKSTKM